MRAGLILMMDRTFTERQNAVIVEKAIRYAPRGIVGIDIAGPRPDGAGIGHGILAAQDEEAVRGTFRAFAEHGVAVTIATDGPEMTRTHLRDEFELLPRIGAVDEKELAEANRRGHEASFVPREPVLQRA